MLKKYPIDVYLLTVLQVVLYVDTSLISLRILNNLKHRRLIFLKTRKKNLWSHFLYRFTCSSFEEFRFFYYT